MQHYVFCNITVYSLELQANACVKMMGDGFVIYHDRVLSTNEPKHQYSFDEYFYEGIRTPLGESGVTVKFECSAFL